MNDKQKILLLLIALICNFTFLATAQNNPTVTKFRKEADSKKIQGKNFLFLKDSKSVVPDTIVLPGTCSHLNCR